MRKRRFMTLATLATLTFLPFGADFPPPARCIRFNGSYSAGTIVIKTNERRLYYVIGDGKAIRYPVGVGSARHGLGRHGLHRRQIHQAGMVGARLDQKGLFPAARGRPGRQPEQSDGRGGDDAERRRRIRHPRHQQSRLGRRVRVPWVHPHVQRRCYGSVQPCRFCTTVVVLH